MTLIILVHRSILFLQKKGAPQPQQELVNSEWRIDTYNKYSADYSIVDGI